MFKVDYKDLYTLISIESQMLDAQTVENLLDKCEKLLEKDTKNIIVDLSACTLISNEDILEDIINLSASIYEKEKSFVLLNLPIKLIQCLKQNDALDSLNYAPTLIEAIDIVSMESLERDILNGLDV